MKLDKNAFQELKQQQVDVSQEKQRAVASLQTILEQQGPNRTCRLCLKPGARRIFGNDAEFNVAVNIRAILGLEVAKDDGKPQQVCGPCEYILRQAAQLRQTAETSQWRLQQEQLMVAAAAQNQQPDWIADESDNHGGFFKLVDTEVARKWQCSKCRKTFNSQDAFTEHENLPSCKVKPRPVQCQTCGMELKNISRLKRHMLIHTGPLYHECMQCPYRTRIKSALIIHERTHTGARPLTCGHCGAGFRSPSGLASHKRRHEPPRYKCDICKGTFTFKMALDNHVATMHSTDKPHGCGNCGQAFATRKMLLNHEVKVHNRPRMRAGVTPTYLRQQSQQNPNQIPNPLPPLPHQLPPHLPAQLPPQLPPHQP